MQAISTLLQLYCIIALLSFISAYIPSFGLKSRPRYSTTNLYAGKPVEVIFEPSGKKFVAEQGDVIADIAVKAGVTIPYKCKQGRCNSCELRLNGRG